MNTLPTLSVPKYSMNIPSTKENISYRPYLVREEKILMIALESEDGQSIESAIIDILSTCIDYKGDVKGLTSYDIEYMFLQLRSVSVGESIDILRRCVECDHANEVKLDINKAKVIFEDQEDVIKLSDDLSLELKYPSINSKLTFDDSESDTEVLIRSAANVLTTIYHGEDVYDARDVSLQERQTFIEGLSNIQFEQVIDYLMNAPYVYYEDVFTCTKCGHKEEFSYTGLIDFFI